MPNSKRQAGTAADSSNAAEVTPSSHNNAKD